MTIRVSVVVTAILLKIRLFCGVAPCRLASSMDVSKKKILVEEDCLVPKKTTRKYFAMSGSINQPIRRNIPEDFRGTDN